jgi:hypothetical protein
MTATIGWEDGHGTDGDDWLGYREVSLSSARDWKARLCGRSAPVATIKGSDLLLETIAVRRGH